MPNPGFVLCCLEPCGLWRGTCVVVGTRSPHSLMDPDIAVYGEGAKAWTGAESAGFARLYGLGAALGYRAAEKAKADRKGTK